MLPTASRCASWSTASLADAVHGNVSRAFATCLGENRKYLTLSGQYTMCRLWSSSKQYVCPLDTELSRLCSSHAAALKATCQTSCDDLIAVGEDLIAARFRSPRHLGIIGGSLGGMLVSAAALQRPELFNTVVSQVPLADTKRYHRLLAGASSTSTATGPVRGLGLHLATRPTICWLRTRLIRPCSSSVRPGTTASTRPMRARWWPGCTTSAMRFSIGTTRTAATAAP